MNLRACPNTSQLFVLESNAFRLSGESQDSTSTRRHLSLSQVALSVPASTEELDTVVDVSGKSRRSFLSSKPLFRLSDMRHSEKRPGRSTRGNSPWNSFLVNGRLLDNRGSSETRFGSCLISSLASARNFFCRGEVRTPRLHGAT